MTNMADVAAECRAREYVAEILGYRWRRYLANKRDVLARILRDYEEGMAARIQVRSRRKITTLCTNLQIPPTTRARNRHYLVV